MTRFAQNRSYREGCGPHAMEGEVKGVRDVVERTADERYYDGLGPTSSVRFMGDTLFLFSKVKIRFSMDDRHQSSVRYGPHSLSPLKEEFVATYRNRSHSLTARVRKARQSRFLRLFLVACPGRTSLA